ncbi:hypothetical protein I7I50_11481 [Histoplasma capsulatum G186AR]|uniref:Uncharacterized protein n=1 Tax=Ajellomyces capsulatus TaxID=5037 RepID=A0A8H8D877_AJECA|nr:hypothetical protein I7I52_02718 [Histoplasma capsulatum]QSS69995.1 hypothetical protein I7I50_11481 [Histoplasma capsulatum G186AR]
MFAIYISSNFVVLYCTRGCEKWENPIHSPPMSKCPTSPCINLIIQLQESQIKQRTENVEANH